MNLGSDYSLVTENPADAETLLAGDRLELTWQLFQGGTWFVSVQVDKIEKALGADGRVKLRSYVYDSDKMLLTLEMEVERSTVNSAELPFMASGVVVTAGALTVLVLVNMIVGATFWFFYQNTRTGKLYRKAAPGIQERLDDPEVPEGEKEILRRGLEDEPSIRETVTTASGALALLAVAVLAVVVYGAKS